jgi:peroxiredoxin
MEKQQAAMKQQQEQQQKLSNLLPVGAVAPEIRQQTPDGGMFALSEMRGKVVLIDFWASWCRPCRMENPNIVKAYNKYRGKGFDILGVSLDRDGNAWKNAIQQDGLTWKHVSDLQWWNNAAAQEYGISSIPFSVLVDKEGKVIDKNLRGPALEAKLEEVLGS